MPPASDRRMDAWDTGGLFAWLSAPPPHNRFNDRTPAASRIPDCRIILGLSP
jgi:hypothetical protein